MGLLMFEPTAGSFRYLDQPYAPMRLLIWVTGRSALHIVLSSGMGQSLQQRYSGGGEVMVLSNAKFVGPPLPRAGLRAVDLPQTVGLLANLSAAKGLDDFLTLAETSKARGLPWRFILVGPFENARDQDRVMPRIAAPTNLDYRGPLYAETKTAFFEEIDIFVFPTRYRHEAGPLVLLEALSHGRPVIAYARGCIAETLLGGGGQTIPVESRFIDSALDTLEAWRSEGMTFQGRSEAARQRFAELDAQSTWVISLLFTRYGRKAS